MDFANLTLNFSFLQAHQQLFAFLIVAGPLLSFLSIKFWIVAKDTANAQRTTQWYVPNASESDATKAVFGHSARPVAFAHQSTRTPRRP